jgi:hypothetical protein
MRREYQGHRDDESILVGEGYCYVKSESQFGNIFLKVSRVRQ